jgi:hypothetical protein
MGWPASSPFQASGYGIDPIAYAESRCDPVNVPALDLDQLKMPRQRMRVGRLGILDRRVTGALEQDQSKPAKSMPPAIP